MLFKLYIQSCVSNAPDYYNGPMRIIVLRYEEKAQLSPTSNFALSNNKIKDGCLYINFLVLSPSSNKIYTRLTNLK